MAVLSRPGAAARGLLVVLLAAAVQPNAIGVAGSAQRSDADGVALLLSRLEQSLTQGRAAAYLALLAPDADNADARAFADQTFRPDVTRAVLRERDRLPLQGTLPDEGFRLLVEALIERGAGGRIVAWRLDVVRDAAIDRWFIVGQQEVSSLDGLWRLALDPTKQFAARNLVVHATDYSLELAEGSVFAATTPEGVTGLVLRGRGTMKFTPAPASERGQLRIFAGAETMATPFEVAFVRLNPYEYEERLSPAALTPRPVDAREFRRAQAFFAEHVGQSFALNLSDLSRDTWSLTPAAGDFLAEVRTKRFGILTYARSGNEPEDITLFDRRRRRNIAVYASSAKLAMLGRHYDEDRFTDYDVLEYDLDADFWPDRAWIDGRTLLRIRTRSRSLTTLTLRLAEPLTVRSVWSPVFGRLLYLRVVGQNSVIVHLPNAVPQDTELQLVVVYSGRLPPQALEREAISAADHADDAGSQEQTVQPEIPHVPAEPRFIYSNRAHWYPQSPVSDYATATLRLTVPVDAECVASGELRESRAIAVPSASGNELRKIFIFVATRPLRYLSAVITRLNQVDSVNVQLGGGPARELSASAARPAAEESDSSTIALSIKANPRQQARGRAMLDRVSRIVRFYGGIVGGAPYPSFTVALTESDLPGGHSPAYFAILNQPLPMSPVTWRGDPVSFDDFPSFFLAHEIAHQWWGQAVGWKNYHEQWLSEGFAQYFAALYAREERGDEVFTNLLRQMRRWALTHSDQGPVSLGYRVGHIKGEGRVFRAIVYNKAAMVLHMLRRLLGDDAFFAGVRRFYQEHRFAKAGTDDLERAMEAESGVTLARFFDVWIDSADVPRLAFSSHAAPPRRESVTLRFEHLGVVVDVPVLVTLVYESGATDELLVRITDRTAEVTVPLTGRLREIEINPDNGALAHFVR
jgi:hypothetical protein